MVSVMLRDGRICPFDPAKLRVLDYFKNAIQYHNTSAFMIYDGRSGMGKSTQAIQDGFYCDMSPSGFGLHKIYFTPDAFIEGLTKAEEFSFHLFDEAMILSSRSSMTEVNKKMVRALSMIRSKRIIAAICINSIFDLDRNLALSRGDVLFHSYGKSLIDRGHMLSFHKGNDGVNRLKMLYLYGKKYYDYSKPRANFIGSFNKRFLVDAGAYEEKKQAGISESLKKAGVPNERIWVYRLLYGLHHNRNISVDELVKISGASSASIKTLIQRGTNVATLDAL